MVDHYLSLAGGLTACFRSVCDIRNDKQAQLQFGAYVPGIEFLDTAPNHIDFVLEHAVSDTPHLECKDNHLTLYAPESRGLPPDLYHLLYGIERRELLKREFYPVHAACVGENDDYILIVGHSGAGKTTLAHNLVEKHGMKLFSGNKTVVRFATDAGIVAVAGTKTMTALDNNQIRYAYEMKYEDYTPQQEVRIRAIVLVRVNDGVEETQVLSPLSALHTLYPYFMDAVNADVIVNGKNVFDGSASAEVKLKLTEGLKHAVESMPVQKHSGPMSFLERKALRS